MQNNSAANELVWVAAGLIVWYAIKLVAPEVAGYILAAIVIGVIAILGPQIAKVGT